MDSRIMARVTATAREGYKPSDLTVTDLQEVNYWISTFENLIDNAVFDYPKGDLPEEVAKLMASIVEDFRDVLFNWLTSEVKDILISIIDNYEEEE